MEAMELRIISLTLPMDGRNRRKIDGTNAQICISDDLSPFVLQSGRVVPFLVGSRTRWIYPENDNYGFAKWAFENANQLIQLGPGNHFGEWWGQGIQRKYNLNEKRFSLFNTTRWAGKAPDGIYVVPVLYEGPIYINREEEDIEAHTVIEEMLYLLKRDGSLAAPGYKHPEGICIFHTASHTMFKITCENDETYKSAIIGGQNVSEDLASA
jgi:hypothetical protein